MLRWTPLLLPLLSATGPAAADTLDDYVAYRSGSFSSAAQAAVDSRYDAVTWHGDLDIDRLTKLDGCDGIIVRAGRARFEGKPPPTRGVVISRFPCLEAAERFWYSDEYAEILPLREGIAEFEVIVLPAPPLPAWVGND